MYIDVEKLWIQAEEELKAAILLIRKNRYYASIVHAYRAVEYGLKSLYAGLYNNLPDTNDIIELSSKLNINDKAFEELITQLNMEFNAKYSDTYNWAPTYLISKETAEIYVENVMKLLDISKKHLK